MGENTTAFFKFQENFFKKNIEYKENYFGIYLGLVEYINDPLQQGRIKVRVPGIHGYPEKRPTQMLDWAIACTAFGGGRDYGAISIPPVGSSVWIMFNCGEVHHPVWLGGLNSATATDRIYLRNPALELPQGAMSMSLKPEDPWIAPKGVDVPLEFLTMMNSRPERHVLYKSTKGTTIDIEERDKRESFNFHDRAGQVFQFESKISDALGTVNAPGNLKNNAQRKLRSGLLGDQLPIESTSLKEASINIIDLSGQHITLNTDLNANDLSLVSREGYQKEDITVASNKETPGARSVTLYLSSSHKDFGIEIKEGTVTKSKIKIDGKSGFMEIETENFIKIKALNITIEGNLDVIGNITSSNNLMVSESGMFGKQVTSTRENLANSISNVVD